MVSAVPDSGPEAQIFCNLSILQDYLDKKMMRESERRECRENESSA